MNDKKSLLIRRDKDIKWIINLIKKELEIVKDRNSCKNKKSEEIKKTDIKK